MISCLQIGDTDLIGNKFNGHDLHLYLKEKNINTNHLVCYKESNDSSTFNINNDPLIREFVSVQENHYNIMALSYYYTYDILYNKLFLNSDIVHMHLIHNYMFNLNLLPIMSKLKPIVWSMHDPWLISGHCVHHFDCNKWQTGCGDCQYLDIRFPISNDNTALTFEIKRDIIERSNISFIAPSLWIKRLLELSPICKDKDIYYIPFGVNQNIFRPEDNTDSIKMQLGIDNDSIVLMCRADTNIYKGFDIIKKALTNIKTDKKITLITTVTTGLIDELKNNIKVIEFDWIKSDIFLSQLYQVCDIFLMPSRQETFGMMAIEAMSCGKMVLALKGTALEDVIDAPNCGIVCDENEYADTLYNLINSKEYLIRGKKSLEFALKHYNIYRYVDNMINTYYKIIENFEIDKKHKYILNQLSKNYSDYKPENINYDFLYRELRLENNKLKDYNDKLKSNLEMNWFGFLSISSNSKYIFIRILFIKIIIKFNNDIINKIAWWIPIKKIRDNFRNKFYIFGVNDEH